MTVGCSLHKVRENVPVPEIIPETYSTGGEAVLPETWWTAFGDSELDRLSDRVLNQNLDLRGAWARLVQFDALARQAGALRMPEVTYTGIASRARTNTFGQVVEGNLFSAQAGVSYEVDLWNRLSSQQRAGLLDYRASRQDLEIVAFSLTGATARTWYGIVAQREQLTLLEEQIEVNRKFLEVIEARFANGVASAVDVFQQRENLASIQAQIPSARLSLELLEHQLATLAGEAPLTPAPEERRTLPELPPLPSLGVPADLLQNRPDVRAAMLRVAAADHRVAVAVADQYPSLRLTGEAGFQADELGDLFSDFVWSAAASLIGPIFDAGRRQAEVDRTEAVVVERLAVYEAVLLDALREVEDALTSEHRRGQLIERLENQQGLAEKALEAAGARYLRGVGNYLTVLTETQALQRVQRELINARQARVLDRIDLYMALGGTWTENLTGPAGIAYPEGDTDE
ncbi:MAG: efflux transporter outer membrane subunit [Acidobacteriota bacterium]|nr:efflux transporter outer membrane subunit [Acidobacteriota bacterium]